MLILDTTNHRIIMFGGGAGAGNYFDDVWEVRLDANGHGEWNRLAPSGTAPPARFEASVVYDPVRHHMVVAAGFDGETYFNDVWTLDLTPGAERWQQQQPTGTPPEPRSHACEVYCPDRRSLILHGGQSRSTIHGDVWELELDSMVWRRVVLADSGPGPRSLSVGAYDSSAGQMVLFGGYDGSRFYNDVWGLSLAPGQETWVELHVAGSTPAARGAPAAGFDVNSRRLFVGCGWDPDLLSDLYSLNLGTGVWTELHPSGEMPHPRRGPAGVYEPYGNHLFVFGGDDFQGFFADSYFLPVGDAGGR